MRGYRETGICLIDAAVMLQMLKAGILLRVYIVHNLKMYGQIYKH